VKAARLVVPVGLLVLAVLSALLAADVRSWSASVASGDAVYAATPARARWTPSTRIDGLAESLLDAGDDVAVRRALQLYVATVGVNARLDNALEVQTARARAQDALERVARDPDPARAAQARTLLGVLAFRAAARGGQESDIDVAASDFADAIREDPSAEPAKFDLELLLRLTAAHGTRTGREPGAGTGQTGRRGAGAGTPGRGY
jgi:hypothetical protein